MRRLICIILLIIPLFSIGQNIVGQALLTESQIAEINIRLSNIEGDYVSTNYNNNGFYGDGNEVLSGAETFLNEEESTGYHCQWTYFTNYVSNSRDSINSNGEPFAKNLPEYKGVNWRSLCTEYIHYAAYMARVWRDETDRINFSGITKTKREHAIDLANAVINVLNEQANDSLLDWGNTARFVQTSAYIGNPLFISMTKMSKYLDSYAYVAQVVTTDNNDVYEKMLGIEQWIKNAVEYAYLKQQIRNENAFGAKLPENITNTTLQTVGLGYNKQHNNTYVYYDINGVGQQVSTLGVRYAINNRNWDFIGLIANYGILFNHTEYKKFAKEMFKLALKVGVMPDGTWFEWDRGTLSSPTNGTTYTGLTMYHLAKIAYNHAVAVENGLDGMTNKGEFFDYTTSEGSSELYMGNSGYEGPNTSGGEKNLKLMLKNFLKHYRNEEDGGFIGVRFAEGGKDPETLTRNPLVGVAMANTYYQDQNLKDGYLQKIEKGYNGARYYGDEGIPVIKSSGAIIQYSLGTSWAESGTHAGYLSLAEMETHVFNNCSNDLPNEDSSIVLSTGVTDAWSGTNTIVGVYNNTTDFDCALKIRKDTIGDQWARYAIGLDLEENSINSGDKIFISIDGKSINGNPRILVMPNINHEPNVAPLIDKEFIGEGEWITVKDTITVPENRTTLGIWLFPNYGSEEKGEALFDNLIVRKLENCSNDLPNDDSSIVLSPAAPDAWSGAKTIQGVYNNTTDFDCALKIRKDTIGNQWARYSIGIDLEENNIISGDELFFSIDGKSISGKTACRVVPDNTTGNTAIISNDFTEQNWVTYKKTITVPEGIETLDIWLFPNYGSEEKGEALFDNLIVRKLENCSNDLPNDDSSIVLSPAAPDAWSGAKTIQGVYNNTTDFDCALKIRKDTIGNQWARYSIGIDLEENNIISGDELFFSIDGKSISGKTAYRVVPDNTTGNTAIISNDFTEQNWVTYTQTITVPEGIETLDIWLFPNYGSEEEGEALFDNLIIRRVNSSSSLKTSSSFLDKTQVISEDIISLYPNPSSDRINISLGAGTKKINYLLHSITGTLIKQENIDTTKVEDFTIDISTLVQGVYIITIIDEKGMYTFKKIIKE